MLKAIIVDDEAPVREAIKILVDWKSADIEMILEASTANDALRIINEQQVEIIITDIRMPGMDGLEMLQSIESDLQKHQIIVISSYEEMEYYKKAMKLHVVDYILKPIDEKEINTAVMTASDNIKSDSKNRTILNKEITRCDEICNYLNDHLPEDISLKDLADRFSLSREHLARIFKEEKKCSIMQYLMDCRINKAKIMLVETNLSNSEIAEKTGFTDTAYFNKCFKSKTAMTPREYKTSINKK